MTRTSQVTLERQTSDAAESNAPASQDVESRAMQSGDRPTLEEIAEEAYAIYIANGFRDGNDVDDWLEAERRVIQRRFQRA